MSQLNVEIVRRFSECWERGDWDGMTELIDPDVEQHGTVGGMGEGRALRGAEEIRQDYERVEEAWDEHRIESEGLIDAGERVVLLLREHQRGKSSGLELS